MLHIVLPAYNEERALEEMLPKMIGVLKGRAYSILVVDDGSGDDTAEIARRYESFGVQVHSHAQNMGLGEALRTGFLAALREAQSDDVIITMDADNTHPVELILTLQEKIGQDLDLVVASRYTPGGKEVGLSFHRRVLSRCASILMGWFFPLSGVMDYSSGFRAYRASLLEAGFAAYGSGLIESKSFAVSVEILLKLSRLSPRCGEAPLALRYDLKRSKSKLPLIRTVLGYLQLIFRLKKAALPQAEVEA